MILLRRKPERSQLCKQTYPSGKVAERLYHAHGQLHQVKFDGSLVDTRLYDDGGRLEKSTYGNGVVTDFTYRDDNLVAYLGDLAGSRGPDVDDRRPERPEHGLRPGKGGLAPAHHDRERPRDRPLVAAAHRRVHHLGPGSLGSRGELAGHAGGDRAHVDRQPARARRGARKEHAAHQPNWVNSLFVVLFGLT